MPRPRYPAKGERPSVTLPPEVRTVGQVVAEAIKLYGANLGPALALGLPVAVADQVVIDASVGVRVAVLVAASPFLSAAYAGACAILGQERPAPRVWLTAIAVGTVTFLPAAPFFPWFALVSILWLGLVGHAVPAVVVERAGPVAAIRRSVALARADYVHAAGSFATLAIVFWLTRIALGLLLSSQAEAAVRVAIFLADVVVSPLLFLGAAIVYVDLAARIGLSTEERRRIRDAAWGRAAK